MFSFSDNKGIVSLSPCILVSFVESSLFISDRGVSMCNSLSKNRTIHSDKIKLICYDSIDSSLLFS